MLAKSWKQICLIILIIACLWNIISKMLYKVSFSETVKFIQVNYKQDDNEKNKAVKQIKKEGVNG